MALKSEGPRVNEIAFTQYLRPDGRSRREFITRGDEVVRMARHLEMRGCEFDIEELPDGTVSMTVEYEDETLAIRLCPNGPQIPPSVDALIAEAHALMFPKRQPRQTEDRCH
jgi:hypothetical protein